MKQADGSSSPTDVAVLIDRHPFSAFNLRLVALSWLITLFDGLDQMMIGFTMPYMRDEFRLSNAMIGWIISSGVAGMMVGGFLFPLLADRIGRRPTVIVTAYAFGALTAATALSQSVPALIALRFLDGLAIGGMLPLAWALNIEFVPRRYRATIVTIVMIGYSIGTALAGPLTNALAPTYGWRAVYYVGGAGTLVCATLLLFWLPESLRFLVNRQLGNDRIVALLRKVAPMARVSSSDRFYLSDEPERTNGFELRQLFTGDLARITPLLWVAYFMSSLAINFMASWGPLILEYLHVARHSAALISASGGLLGAGAGLLLMRFTDRAGPVSVAFFPALAAPMLLALGLGAFPADWLLPSMIVATVLINGGHYGTLSISGIYYPSAIRATGAGWATSISKCGGILGPIAGAAILSSGLPILRSYAALAVCPLILAACALAIARVVQRRRAPDPGAIAPVPA